MPFWMRLRDGVLAAAIVLVWITCFAGLLTSCGGNHRQDTIRASVIATNTARDALMRWNHDRQQQIVKDSPTREVYEQRIATHRARYEKIRVVVWGVYERLAVASAGKSERELDDAIKAAKKVADALKALDPKTEGPKVEDLPPPPIAVEPCANGSTAPCPSLDAIRDQMGITADAGVDAP